MKILFNLMSCGLGNNGGSSTIVKSANTLKKLGHEVTVIDTGRNQHTWTPLNVEHKIIKSFNKVPDADVVIATGYGTVRSTVRLPKRCGIKVHWIRGWETWNKSEKQIVNSILGAPTIKIVNSKCLKLKLESLGYNSEIIRPGYDLGDFTQLKIRNKTNDVVFLGGQYNEGSKRKSKRVNWIIDAVKILRRKYRIQLWMMGTERKPNIDVIDKYFQKPDKVTKNTFYNHVNIWLAPTELEGLHMPPAEAMLTGCPVVCTNAPMSGMQDYVVGGENGLIAENDFNSFVETIEKFLKNKDMMFNYGSVARERVFKLGNRENNMKKMVEYFELLKL